MATALSATEVAKTLLAFIGSNEQVFVRDIENNKRPIIAIAWERSVLPDKPRVNMVLYTGGPLP